MSENVERLVEYYFQIVEKGLKEEGIWGETVRRFPPSAIREAVRRIVERCIETYWPLENVDWRTVFEKLKDHGSVESFIKDLEEKREIPPSPEEEAREYALRELAEAAARLKQRVLEEKEYEKLLSAHREVTSIRKKLHEVEKERDEWRKKYEETAKKYVEETESLKREIESLKREIEKLKAAPPPPTPPPTPAAVKLTPEDEEKLEKLFKHILISEIGKVPKEAIEEFARELENLRALSYEEAAKIIQLLALEIAEREKAPKVLPPMPEKCPIDGSPIREVTRVPIGPVPVRLTAEEEEFRRRVGLPVPERELVWVDVPPTMKVYACEMDHLFERDPATGRLIQRTPEYVYRKILRETAALRKAAYPEEAAPPAPVYYYLPPPPRPMRLQNAWWDWLERVKGLTKEQFMALSWEEKERIRKEWGEWVRRTGGRGD